MKILSYNIQAAIGAKRYSDYVLASHRQFFHTPRKDRILHEIADYMSGFDIACLQEVDLGGRRSAFTQQTDILTEKSGLNDCALQLNRVVGNTSHHGNAILARENIQDAEDHKLPGKMPGRGVQKCKIGRYTVLNTHLSLGKTDQSSQFDFINSLIKREENVICVGDFNCNAASPHLETFAQRTGLRLLTGRHSRTFPAWMPKQDIDHVLVSPNLANADITVGDVLLSDHRPLEITLPD